MSLLLLLLLLIVSLQENTVAEQRYQAILELHKLQPFDPSVLRLRDIKLTTVAAAHTVAGLMHRSCSCTQILSAILAKTHSHSQSTASAALQVCC